MEHNATALSVCLRGSRNYVQGSQILGRAGEWIEGLGHAGAVLTTAKFTAITTKPVNAVILGDTAQPAGGQIGEARYETENGALTVGFFEIGPEPAGQIEDEPSRRTSFEDHGGGNGVAQFRTDGRHEAYLAAVIETVKALHASLGAKVDDIWFTALANARLPLAAASEPVEGRLEITRLLARNHRGRQQTLSQVATTLTGNDQQIAPFNIAFSCLIREA